MGKGGNWCSAPNCTSNSNTDKHLSFFRFPKDQDRAQRWVVNCGRKDLLNKNADYLYINCKMCSKHFEHSMFYNFLKNRLKENAAPTLFGITNRHPKVTVKIEEVVVKTEPTNDAALTETGLQLQTLIPIEFVNVECQTEKPLIATAPRKDILRSLKAKDRTIRKLRQQLIASTADDTVENFENLCYKFLPKNLAQLVTSQAKLFKTSGNGKGS